MGNASNTSVFTSTLSEREDLIFGSLYLVFGVLSLAGNSLLLLLAHHKRSLLKPAEFFIVNLAVSDLSMTVTLFPLATSSFFAHRWLFGQALCTLYAFCGVLFGLGSLGSLTALSTVCCLKVCYPAYGSRFSRRHAALLLPAVWGYALAFAAAPLARWGRYGPEPYGTACCIAWEPSGRAAALYILALLIFCYLLPCLLILLSYALILWTVRGSRRAVRQHTGPARGARGGHGLLLKLSVAVCLGFLAAWTPYAVLALWALLGDPGRVPALAFVLSAVFAKSSTLYNPLVHLLLKPSFHSLLAEHGALLRALRALQGCGCGCCTAAPRPCPSPALRCCRCSAAPRPCLRACSGCRDALEHFRSCPRCCSPPGVSGSSAQPGPLAELAGGAAGLGRAGQGMGLGRAGQVMVPHRVVQVLVLLTPRWAGLGTASVVREALPSAMAKDLL